MKIKAVIHLICPNDICSEEEATNILTQVKDAIGRVHWPPGANDFTIHPIKQANGVKPIKDGCMEYLHGLGWSLEEPMKIASLKRPGKIDAVYTLDDGRKIAVEWETGNISSSHRALNKMTVGLLSGALFGGVLILPTRVMYKYLTDRVGNLEELEPYFPMWKSICVDSGFLSIIAIEHDHESLDVPRIAKGTDGRALV